MSYKEEINKVNIQSKLNALNEFWSPKIIAELNNQQVKIAKFKGEFVMHHHQNEDELFYVIKGTLFIKLKDEIIELNTGEFVIIPQGVDHQPYANEEVSVMLFEPKNTLNTGNITNTFTKPNIDTI